MRRHHKMQTSESFSLKLIPASELSFENLSYLVNRAYEDYYFPIWMDAAHFQQMCDQEDIDLSRSVVALDGEQPIGLAMLSIRGDHGWISGVGVLPAWQRRGIARAMLRTIQNTAGAANLHTLRLEVLVQNEAARELYRQTGFTCERDLLILMLESWSYRTKPLPEDVVPAAPGTLLAAYPTFHDVSTPWQRQLPSLQHRAKNLHGFGLRDGDDLVGYVLYSAQTGTYSILDLAISPAHPHRLDAARTLLRALNDAHANIRRYIYTNIPADDPLLPAFTGLGYNTWYQQHELVWKLETRDSAPAPDAFSPSRT